MGFSTAKMIKNTLYDLAMYDVTNLSPPLHEVWTYLVKE